MKRLLLIFFIIISVSCNTGMKKHQVKNIGKITKGEVIKDSIVILHYDSNEGYEFPKWQNN